MKKLFTLVGMLVLVFALGACGSDGKGSGAKAGKAFKKDASGKATKECSDEIIADFKKAGQAPQAQTRLEALKGLRKQLADFKAEYKGVVCDALNDETGKVEPQDVDKVVGELLTKIDEAIKAEEGGAGNGGGFGGGDDNG